MLDLDGSGRAGQQAVRNQQAHVEEGHRHAAVEATAAENHTIPQDKEMLLELVAKLAARGSQVHFV